MFEFTATFKKSIFNSRFFLSKILQGQENGKSDKARELFSHPKFYGLEGYRRLARKYRDYLVIVITVLLPWQARYFWPRFNGDKAWEYGTFSIFALEILIWLGFLIFIFSHEGGGKKFFAAAKNILKASWIFLPMIVWLLASFIWSQDLTASATWLFHILSAAIYGWLWWQLPREKKFWALALAAVIGYGSIIITWFTQNIDANKWLGLSDHNPAFLGQSVVQFGYVDGVALGERWLRAYGVFPHPNIAGGFVVLTLLSLWLLAHKINKSWAVSITVFLSAIGAAALVASMSKSAALALIIMAIFWLIFFRDSFWKFPIAVFLGLLIFTVIAWPQVEARLRGIQTFEQQSRFERILGYKEAWQQKTWLGTGINVSTKTLEAKVVLPPQPVHNVPLLILTELGAIGLALVLGTLAVVIWFSRAYRDRQFLLILFTAAPLLVFDHYLMTIFAGIILVPLVLGNLAEKAEKLLWD